MMVHIMIEERLKEGPDKPAASRAGGISGITFSRGITRNCWTKHVCFYSNQARVTLAPQAVCIGCVSLQTVSDLWAAIMNISKPVSKTHTLSCKDGTGLPRILRWTTDRWEGYVRFMKCFAVVLQVPLCLTLAAPTVSGLPPWMFEAHATCCARIPRKSEGNTAHQNGCTSGFKKALTPSGPLLLSFLSSTLSINKGVHSNKAPMTTLNKSGQALTPTLHAMLTIDIVINVPP